MIIARNTAGLAMKRGNTQHAEPTLSELAAQTEKFDSSFNDKIKSTGLELLDTLESSLLDRSPSADKAPIGVVEDIRDFQKALETVAKRIETAHDSACQNAQTVAEKIMGGHTEIVLKGPGQERLPARQPWSSYQIEERSSEVVRAKVPEDANSNNLSNFAASLDKLIPHYAAASHLAGFSVAAVFEATSEMRQRLKGMSTVLAKPIEIQGEQRYEEIGVKTSLFGRDEKIIVDAHNSVRHLATAPYLESFPRIPSSKAQEAAWAEANAEWLRIVDGPLV